jgi:predicted dehydrogenase
VPVGVTEDPKLAGELCTIDGDRLDRRRVTSPRGDYGGWYDALARAINTRDETALAVGAEEARDVIRLVELAWTSVRERRTVDVADGELRAKWASV